MNQIQRFFHFYSQNHGDSRPTMTVSMMVRRDEESRPMGISFGFARCCDKDTPIKHRGRMISAARAQAALDTKQTKCFQAHEGRGYETGTPKFVYFDISSFSGKDEEDIMDILDETMGYNEFSDSYDTYSVNERLAKSIKHLLDTNKL